MNLALKRLKVKKQQNWLSYNTLCCDISYHLGYTYVRSERIIYAIAEAEMAIGYAVHSDDSKFRRKKCWGLLALALSASGQNKETERALKEVRALSIGAEGEEEISLLLSFIKHWEGRRSRKHALSESKTKSATNQKCIDEVILLNKKHLDEIKLPEDTTHLIEKDNGYVYNYVFASVASLLAMIVSIIISIYF